MLKSKEGYPGLTPDEVQQVPNALQKFSEWFIKTHNIKGSADPMYVCNATAFELGIGNGSGEFYTEKGRPLDEQVEAGTVDAYIVKTVRKLMMAYATCISDTNGSEKIIKSHVVKMLIALRAQTETRENWITPYLTIQDGEGDTVNGVTAELTVRQLSTIAYLAGQLILDKKAGKPITPAMDRLEEELLAANVI